MPREMSRPARERFNLVVPRSRCGQCSHAITALENIPIISWLALRGRCGACGTRISARYRWLKRRQPPCSLPAPGTSGLPFRRSPRMTFCAVLVTLTGIDLDTQLPPDQLTLPALVVLARWSTCSRCSRTCQMHGHRCCGRLWCYGRSILVIQTGYRDEGWVMVTSNCWEHLVRGSAGKHCPCCCSVSSVVGAVIGIAILHGAEKGGIRQSPSARTLRLPGSSRCSLVRNCGNCSDSTPDDAQQRPVVSLVSPVASVPASRRPPQCLLRTGRMSLTLDAISAHPTALRRC